MLVLGHTKCGAVYGATKTFLDAQGFSKKPGSALQGLLQDLGVVAQQAQEEMGPGANADAIAAHAVQVNVFHTMNFLLSFSESIREAVRSGQIEIHGGIYDLETGSVEFLGKSPQQAQLLESSMPVPPSMSSGAAADHGMHGVRTGADVAVKPEAALKLLKQGNERFAVGAHLHGHARGLGEVRPGAPQRHPWLCGLASARQHRLRRDARRPLRAPQRRQHLHSRSSVIQVAD